MKKISTLVLFAIAFCISTNAQQIFGPGHHIVVYSTHPVDTTVAKPSTNKATALIRSAGDTLIAYINRAKYSLDIALYDYVEDSTWYEGGYVPPIHTAINNAYARGVKIRWIHNPSDSSKGFVNSITPNYGLALINKAIPTLPSASYSGIMHNKFVVIDGRASDPTASIVWTGCMNWEPGQICKDINNIIIFQDSALAHCYLIQFNQMWGDTVEGGVPNTAVGVFGPKEKNITPHNFHIDGYYVESYFSPADQTSNHIISTIQSATSEVDFEMFTFTLQADDAPLVSAVSKGLNVHGIMDQSSLGYTPYTDLSNAMGANLLIYSGLPGYYSNGICHSKYVMTDPCDYSADPKILTGSHNWSSSANTVNDENTVIVHDSLVVNQYYQAFRADYFALSSASGNPVELKQSCNPLAGIKEVQNNIDEVTMYPNPANNEIKVMLNIPGNNIQYGLYNELGQLVLSGKLDARYVNTINVTGLAQGMYLMRVQTSNTKEFTGKFIKQ